MNEHRVVLCLFFFTFLTGGFFFLLYNALFVIEIFQSSYHRRKNECVFQRAVHNLMVWGFLRTSEYCLVFTTPIITAFLRPPFCKALLYNINIIIYSIQWLISIIKSLLGFEKIISGVGGAIINFSYFYLNIPGIFYILFIFFIVIIRRHNSYELCHDSMRHGDCIVLLLLQYVSIKLNYEGTASELL